LVLRLRSSGTLVALTTNRGIERRMCARAPPEEIFISDGAGKRRGGRTSRSLCKGLALHPKRFAFFLRQ
jgi:hypothetical protein